MALSRTLAAAYILSGAALHFAVGYYGTLFKEFGKKLPSAAEPIFSVEPAHYFIFLTGIGIGIAMLPRLFKANGAQVFCLGLLLSVWAVVIFTIVKVHLTICQVVS